MRMAGTTGLEPATSAVTGQRSNQLNYVPRKTPQRPEVVENPHPIYRLETSDGGSGQLVGGQRFERWTFRV